MQLKASRLNHAKQSFHEQYGREAWYGAVAADPQHEQIIVHVHPGKWEQLGTEIQDEWEGFPLSWRDLEASNAPAGPSGTI